MRGKGMRQEGLPVRGKFRPHLGNQNHPAGEPDGAQPELRLGPAEAEIGGGHRQVRRGEFAL